VFLPLNVIWFVGLILVLAVFSIAYLISVRLFWVLILSIIVVGLALTVVSILGKRRLAAQEAAQRAALLDYLKSRGIGGNLPEIANNLGLTEEKTIKILLTLEKQGVIPPESSKAFASGKPDAT